jgi:hypothetical protein
LTDEVIVRGNRVVSRWISGKGVGVHIQPEYLAEEALDILARAEWVAGTATVSERGVQQTVAPESEPSGFMIRECRLVYGNDRGGAARVGQVRVRRRNVVAPNFGIATGIGQVHVKEPVRRETRVEGETENSAFTSRGDLRRQVQKGRREHRARGEIEYLDSAGFFNDEQAIHVIGRGGHEKRLRETACHAHRGDRGDLRLRTRGIEAVDNVVCPGALECVAAVVASNEHRMKNRDCRVWVNPESRRCMRRAGCAL